jgi:hypothetical protein
MSSVTTKALSTGERCLGWSIYFLSLCYTFFVNRLIIHALVNEDPCPVAGQTITR